jgi:adenine-specific DNA-methyltransferase
MAIKKNIEQNQNVQPNTELIQTLKTFLPQYFDAQGNFKLDKFETELKESNISEARDGYRLSFIGKDYARLQTGQSSETLIVPDVNHNNLPDNVRSENVFITGDNLEALRHLQNAYNGKIKMIYIDPPYNTGKEFVYNDKFEFTDEKLKNALGYGDAEIERLKSIQGKSSHSAWLTFMYPRLKLAQKLLTEDGVIFISIDDNEQANLKLLLDDIFGEGQYIASAPRKTGAGAAATRSESELRKLNDYIFIYAKDGFTFKQKIVGEKTYPYEDEYGSYNLAQFQASGSDATRAARPKMYYPIYELPDGTLTTKKSDNAVRTILPNQVNGLDGRWMWKPEKFENDKEQFISYINGKIERKVYYDETEDQTKYQSEKAWFEQFPNATGTTHLNELMGVKGLFSNPKPVELISFLLNLIDDKEFLVLDFFAGSGTTAEAVINLNSKDGGKRKFIMVQWDEVVSEESAAFKAGYKTIDEISRARIAKVASRKKAENPMFSDTLDLGFKHFKLIEPKVSTINKLFEFDPNSNKLFDDDMITPFEHKPFGATGLQTILQTWLVIDGYDFNVSIESIQLANYNAHYIRENAVLYLIDRDFSIDSIKSLLNKIGKNELAINTIILYPYSFSFEQMRELKNNLKNNIEQQVTILERF